MVRTSEPWWWKDRQAWFVTIDGVGSPPGTGPFHWHGLLSARRISTYVGYPFATLFVFRAKSSVRQQYQLATVA
jgi:hypothetical protein